MKKHKKHAKTTPVRRGRLLSVITITVAAIVVVGTAITVLSKQSAQSKVTETRAPAASADKRYVTVKVAGRNVQVDPQTGQIKPLTQEEAKQLADGLKTMLNKSTAGLAQVQNEDGSLSMDLQGRFQNVVLARVNADGAVEQSCVDEPLAAARFLGIDPQLLGVEPPKGATTQPIVRTPAKRAAQ